MKGLIDSCRIAAFSNVLARDTVYIGYRDEIARFIQVARSFFEKDNPGSVFDFSSEAFSVRGVRTRKRRIARRS